MSQPVEIKYVTAEGVETGMVETGGQVALDVFHSLIHHGWFHNVQLKKTGQNTTNVSNITFTVPTTTSTNKRAGIHARIDAKVIGGIAISIQSVASYTGGDAKTPVNLNDNYANTMDTVFVTDATLTDGVEREEILVGSTAATAVGATESVFNIPERIFKPGGKYSLVITPLVNGTRFNVSCYVYERYLV